MRCVNSFSDTQSVVPEYTDESGRVWIDDASIPDAERLFRRVPPRHFQRQDDGTMAIASAAFDDWKGEPMSVYLDSELTGLSLGPADTLIGHEGYAVAELLAGRARALHQVVVRDPDPPGDPHPCDPAHAVVPGKKSTKQRGRLRDAAQWAVPPKV